MADVLHYQKPLAPPAREAPEASRLPLELGSVGPAVRELQRRLNMLSARLEVDGHYGEAVQASVKRLQEHCRLPPTGVADARTWAALVEMTGAGTVSRPNVRQGGAAAPTAARPAGMGAGMGAAPSRWVRFSDLSWLQRGLMVVGAGALVYASVQAVRSALGSSALEGAFQGLFGKPERELNPAPTTRCSRAPATPPYAKFEEAQIIGK